MQHDPGVAGEQPKVTIPPQRSGDRDRNGCRSEQESPDGSPVLVAHSQRLLFTRPNSAYADRAATFDGVVQRRSSSMRLVVSMSVRTAALRAIACSVVLLAVTSQLSAADRREQPTETKTGTIVEIKEKGRGRLLVVEIDGKQQNVPVTPKLDLEVVAAGDKGFVRPGQFLTATATMSNDKLFISSVTIHPQRRGQKPPVGKIAKAPAEEGQSMMAYDVSGLIVATQQNKDYPDHTDVALKTSGQSPPIMLEPNFAVTVSSGDPEKIPANASAEFKVAELRGGRMSILGITVRLDTPLVAAEYFGDKPVEAPKAEAPAGGDSALKSSP